MGEIFKGEISNQKSDIEVMRGGIKGEESIAVVQKNRRKQFNIWRELKQIEQFFDDLPNDDVCYKSISHGGFSSIGFVEFIAQRAKINELYVSTLRVGRKHLWVLDSLKRQGRLDKCVFVVGGVMKNDSTLGKSYKYYDDLETVCKNNGWEIRVLNNHSKILLFDTDRGKFIIETSSNLNENPNIEQFSFYKDDELWRVYREFFEEVTKNGEGEQDG
ncbi:MAG: hypothetical protein UH824_00070 [Acutalibacteraceae bacterium]|nr:hypothetical protein [Acutalibacteraceae bacterium]